MNDKTGRSPTTETQRKASDTHGHPRIDSPNTFLGLFRVDPYSPDMATASSMLSRNLWLFTGALMTLSYSCLACCIALLVGS